jgi:hypothetical protein
MEKRIFVLLLYMVAAAAITSFIMEQNGIFFATLFFISSSIWIYSKFEEENEE